LIPSIFFNKFPYPIKPEKPERFDPEEGYEEK